MPARILAFDASRGEESRVRMAAVTPMTSTAAPAHRPPVEREWPGDEIALSRFLAGDVLGFEQIVRYYGAMVFSLAARLVGPSDAEDVVQETFLRAYHGLAKFRGESSLKTWLYAIALNRARARMGTLGRLRAMFVPGRSREDDPFASLDDAADPAASPEENAVLKERRTRLRAAIRALPEEFRAAVLLRDLEGLSYEEVAEVLGIPIGTVRSRLARGRALLKEKLS
jgi:RNA polymerase sigma-70 factor (ECF subfamily)